MAQNLGAQELLVRVAAGSVAAAMFFFAQGVVSVDEASLGDVIVALIAHGLAAGIIFGVFFASRRTRIRSLVPLAEAPLELEALGRERDVHLTLDRLRRRLGLMYLAVALVILASVIALTFVGRSYALAAAVIESRGGYVWLSLALLSASLMLVTGCAFLASHRWALSLADVTGFVVSAGFPVGTAVALYTWWGTRTLRGAVSAPPAPTLPRTTAFNAIVSVGETRHGSDAGFQIMRWVPLHERARWRLAMIALAATFAYFVWPTPWRYDRLRGVEGNEMPVRVNRFTGTTQLLSPNGWQERASR